MVLYSMNTEACCMFMGAFQNVDMKQPVSIQCDLYEKCFFLNLFWFKT